MIRQEHRERGKAMNEVKLDKKAWEQGYQAPRRAICPYGPEGLTKRSPGLRVTSRGLHRSTQAVALVRATPCPGPRRTATWKRRRTAGLLSRR